MSPRSPRVSTPLAPDPKGRSSQDEDEHCVHKVFLKDFNLIYTVFTADILWAVNEAYAEHNALAFELSADVIATPDTRYRGHAFVCCALRDGICNATKLFDSRVWDDIQASVFDATNSTHGFGVVVHVQLVVFG